ncbi:hypothetical protein L873DRAFT_1803865 [Choiromyces venosus 120613-1]|uniref:Uncharacterized protein n=1 Tax=Choiromyces venosus 120613-1 TaxID=1336337 RepID=A0A3N4K5Z3_9PEZI|nr:hypothetical protein L873DRAFT_1803865 [Choiromyces venosus 120613-1]
MFRLRLDKPPPRTSEKHNIAYQRTSPNIITYMPYISHQRQSQTVIACHRQYGVLKSGLKNRENSARFSFSFFRDKAKRRRSC